MNHTTVSVNGQGIRAVNIVKDEHLENHVQYNLVFRFGCLLFVDGKYVGGGVLKEEFLNKKIKEWETKISNMNIDTSEVSLPYL